MSPSVWMAGSTATAVARTSRRRADAVGVPHGHNLLLLAALLTACGPLEVPARAEASDGPTVHAAREAKASDRPGVPAVREVASSALSRSQGARADSTNLATPRRIATFEGQPFQSVNDVTPDGSRILVSHYENGQLALVDLESRELHWLTRTDEPWQPTWAFEAEVSPSGERIAYHQHDNRTNRWTLGVMGSDGSDPTPLSDGPLYWNQPVAWSPDERFLLSVSTRDESRLIEYDVETGEGRQLRSFPSGSGVAGVHYTPDGAWITHTHSGIEGQPDGVHLLKRDLSVEIPLEGIPAGSVIVGWSPDGRWIVFRRTLDGTPALFRQRFEGTRATGEPVLVQGDRWATQDLGFDVSGRLYYHVDTNVRSLQTVSLDDGGFPASQPARYPGTDRIQRPQYAPDGESLFYVRGGRFVIESRTTGTRRAFDLPLPVGPSARVRWAPDAKSLIVRATDDRRRYAIYRYDLQTAAVDTLRVWNGDEAIWATDVTPDGRDLVFALRAGSAGMAPHRIDALDLETLEERTLIELPYAVSRPTVSPSGDSIAFLAEGRLLMMPRAGGEPRLVLEDEGIDFYRTEIAWHPSGASLFITPGRPTGEQRDAFGRRVVRVDRASGETTEVVRPSESSGEILPGLSIRPDGSEISFVQSDPGRSEIWVLDGLFPAVPAGAEGGAR